MAPPPTLPDLRSAIARGNRFKYLLFWGHTAGHPDQPGPWVLSQWWHAPFTLDGHTYATAEHWMMASKARLFSDPECLSAILTARSPGHAKALGRQVRGYDDAAWAAARRAIVERGSIAKFSQHPALRDYLLGTRTRVLVEASPTDRIWGIGLAATSPDATRPQAWRGENLLGFALMAAREAIRAG